MKVRPGAGQVMSVFLAGAVGAALLSGCGGGKKNALPPATTVSATSTSTTVPTTTTVPKKHGPVCPLTGTPGPKGKVPHRPALAVKIENLAAARPQYGLDHADIVFEEPVEGGITRFVAVYQCHNAPRLEPVRSGRFVDLSILEPLGKTLFAYSGAIDPVISAIDSSSFLEDVGADKEGEDYYFRDPNRYAPHNLYTSTALLYKAGALDGYPDTRPNPLFKYGALQPGSKPASAVHINFPLDVTSWTWDATADHWLRSYSDTGPAMQGDNVQISANNVVILHVQEVETPYVEDPTGAHEYTLTLTGSGPAWVLRNGAVFKCAWFRPSLADPATFVGPHHEKLTLSPGNTWVELVPYVSTVNLSP